MPTPVFIDSHAHIDGPEYDSDREEVIARARDSGVVAILNVGTGDPHSGALERCLELAERHEEVYAAVGTHPHDAKLFDHKAEERIRGLVRQSERMIAWGEIGLDYHYDNSPRDVQREVFVRQLRAARECGLPVIIHTRDADDDTIEILSSEWKDNELGGIMHCFGGSLELAQTAIKLGFMVSFSGNVTFKKATDIRDVATCVPLERLLIETDCPFLSPEPYRGRRNEPARVIEVARSVAVIHEETVDRIAEITTRNFTTLFNLQL